MASLHSWKRMTQSQIPPHKLLAIALVFGVVGTLLLAADAMAQNPAPPPAASPANAVGTPSVADSKSPAAPGSLSASSGAPAQTGGTHPVHKTCGFAAITDLKECGKDFLHDQAGIWTSPAHVRSRDLFWLLPFGAATGAAILTDSNALNGLQSHPTLAHDSRIFSETGSPYVTIGASLLLYGIGAGKHNDTLRETGILSTEAVVDTAVVVGVLKLATNRERPFTGTGQGRFWPGGTSNYPAGFSMPSMHAAGSWAMARVIAGEYPSNTPLKILVYGWAAAVSVTRVTGQKHFPSDVIVGGTIGYLIGGYVVRHHSSAHRDDFAYTILPFSDPNTRSYGVSIAVPPESLQPEAIAHTFRTLASHVRLAAN